MATSKKDFLKKMIGFSMLPWITAVIGFISSPIATRLFVPAELAQVNIFTTYAGLFSACCYLGLDQAFVRFFQKPPKNMNQRGLFSFCIFVALGFSILSSAILLVFFQNLSIQIVGTENIWVLACLCFYTFCSVMFRFLSLSYRMEQNALLYTVQGVMQALFTKIAYLAVGFGAATGSLAIMSLTALMGILTVVFVIIQRKRFTTSLHLSTKASKDIASYALPLLPLALLSFLNSSVSIVVLDLLMGKEVTGIYNSALVLASTVNIIQTGFNAYYAPYVLSSYQSDESRRFDTIYRLMACILCFFALGLTLFQVPIFLLLGESYRASMLFFPLLLLSPICYCMGETTGMGIMLSKKTYWTTLIFLFSSLVNIGLCYVFIPIFGMSGAAMASASSAILTLILRTLIGEKLFRAIQSPRQLIYTVSIIVSLGIGNLLLVGVAKYAVIVLLIHLAALLYHKELLILWRTAFQLLQGLHKGGKKHA